MNNNRFGGWPGHILLVNGTVPYWLHEFITTESYLKIEKSGKQHRYQIIDEEYFSNRDGFIVARLEVPGRVL